MRGLKELLEADPKTLTEEETQYLKRFKHIKRVKHSTSFTAHVRDLPKEINGNSV